MYRSMQKSRSENLYDAKELTARFHLLFQDGKLVKAVERFGVGQVRSTQ